MVKKCCVTGCKSGYLTSHEKVPVFRLPSDPDEYLRWLEVLKKVNKDSNVTDDTVVCVKHWPVGYSVGKWRRPLLPPSVFDCGLVYPSGQERNNNNLSIESINCEIRRSMLEHSYAMAAVEGEENKDLLDYEQLRDGLINGEHRFETNTVRFEDENKLYCMSKSFNQGIPTFVIIILRNLKFEAYHLGVKTIISTLSKKRITTIDRWSRIDDAVMFLNSMEIEHKKAVLLRNIKSLGVSSQVGERVYDMETMVSCFDYASRDRTLYNSLKQDYPFPCLKTLQRITSKMSNVDDRNFIARLFFL